MNRTIKVFVVCSGMLLSCSPKRHLTEVSKPVCGVIIPGKSDSFISVDTPVPTISVVYCCEPIGGKDHPNPILTFPDGTPVEGKPLK